MIRLEKWSVVFPGCLMGIVYGHPRLFDGAEIITSIVSFLDIPKRKAITASGSHYYLGDPDPSWTDFRKATSHIQNMAFLSIDPAADDCVDQLVARRLENATTPSELETMTRGGFDTIQREQVGLTPLGRGVAELSTLVSESLTVAAVAGHLGVADRRIRQRLTSRTLYGFKVGRIWKLPRFQFTRDGEVPGIAQVISAFPRDLHPVEVLTWFHTPNSDLYRDEDAEHPMTPLDWLCSGYDPKTVAELAEHL